MTTFRITRDDSAALTVDWADIRIRCAAAARLAMRNADLYSDDDRSDCAAHLLATVLEKVGSADVPADRPTGATTRFDPARETRRTYVLRMLRYMDAAERGAATARNFERAVPRESVSMTRLANLAANYRRSVLRDRERDATSVEMRGDAWTVPSAESVVLDRERVYGPAVPVTPILRRLPAAGRVPAVAIAIYGALRELDGAALAHELEMTGPACRKAASRGAGILRTFGDAADWRVALDCAVHSTVTRDDIGPARAYMPRERTHRSRALSHSERVTGTEVVRRSMGDAPRMTDDRPRAVKLYTPIPDDIRERSCPTVKMWTARSGQTAGWVTSMTPGRATVRTRSRLAVSARITRERTYNAPMAERSTRRLAAGIARPPVVPAARKVTRSLPRESATVR